MQNSEPDHTSENYIPKLEDIIDLPELQSLMDNFYNLTHIPTAIIDIDGKVLVGVGWQNICTKFHRVHPVTQQNCIASDTELTTGIPDGQFKMYKCRNGMWDLATPIIIGGQHFGNLFMGQFFFDNETIDFDFFRSNAARYGFNEEEYLSSLSQVPRLNANDLDSAKTFFTRIAHSISGLGYANIKLTRLLNERNQLVSSLKQSEERFRVMFEKHKAVMLLIEPESGQIIDANNAASEFYGWSHDHLCTMKIEEINLLSKEEVANERQTALEEKRNHFIFPHRLANNQQCWVEVYSSPINVGNKQLLFSVIHDITERKRVEDQLSKLSLAIEHSPDSIVITDYYGTIEYVNPMFTRVTGYSSEEAIGQNPRIMKSGRTSPVIYKRMWANIKNGLQWRGAFENKKKSGELFWESVNISPVTDKNGKITNFVAIKEDITDRIRHEEQLYKLNRTLRAIRHIGDAIIRADDEPSFLYDICSIIVDDCGYTLVWIGYAEDDENKTIRPVSSAGFEEGYLEQLKVTWADVDRGHGPTGTSIRSGKVVVCKDLLNDNNFSPWREEAAKRGYASSIALPLKTSEKVVGSLTIYSREVNAFSKDEVDLLTELADDVSNGISVIRLRETNTRAQAELYKINKQLQFEIQKEKQVELLLKDSLEKEKELNELKSRFISTTSHEFRTPLTSILSSVQLIQRYRKKWNDDQLEEQFGYIKNSIVNLTRLLDDILTISYADSGRIVFNPKSVDLKQLCLEIIEDVKHKAGIRHQFQFNFLVPEKEYLLDPKLIRFVVINLLSNAFKYSPEGGQVKLDISSPNGNLIISVSDEGIGIPKEAHEHLFRPFFRAGNTGEIEGTGLGLSIVQRAVELHNGNIDFISAKNKGTKFTVQIPKGSL